MHWAVQAELALSSAGLFIFFSSLCNKNLKFSLMQWERVTVDLLLFISDWEMRREGPVSNHRRYCNLPLRRAGFASLMFRDISSSA